MRPRIVTILGLSLAVTLGGCGGASLPDAPSNAKFAPPPGGSPPEMLKATKNSSSNNRAVMPGGLPGS